MPIAIVYPEERTCLRCSNMEFIPCETVFNSRCCPYERKARLITSSTPFITINGLRQAHKENLLTLLPISRIKEGSIYGL